MNKAAKERPSTADEDRGETLVAAEITTRAPETPASRTDVFGHAPARSRDEEKDVDVASVFGKLKGLKVPN